MTRYFVEADGTYIGGFDVEADDLPGLLPAGAVEIPEAPEHAAQLWNFATSTFNPPPAPERRPLTADELFDVLKTKGVLVESDRPLRSV